MEGYFITDGNVAAHITDHTANGQPVAHAMAVILAGSFMSEAEIVEKTEEFVDEFCESNSVVPSVLYRKIHMFIDSTVVHLHC